MTAKFLYAEGDIIIMNIEKITRNGTEIAIVKSDEVCISNAQSAIDLMMSVNYETTLAFLQLYISNPLFYTFYYKIDMLM